MSPLRILLWAAAVSLIFGAIEFGGPLESALRISRNALRQHDASGEIVVVAIDDRTLAKLDKWPFPRRRHAQMIEELRRLGAKRIFFDIDFSSQSNATDDAIFEAALTRMEGEVTLPIQFAIDHAGNRTDVFPMPAFRNQSKLAAIDVWFDRQGAVWELPFALESRGKPYPSVAASLAGVQGRVGDMWRLDYAIDPGSVPTISAVDLIEGRVTPQAISGRDVVIATASVQIGDIHFAPGYGAIPGVYIQVLGAETLRNGIPFDLGWFFPLLAGLTLAGSCLLLKKPGAAIGTLAGGVVAILLAQFALDHFLIFADVMPALALLLINGAALFWSTFRHSYRVRGTINSISGLPNLAALRVETVEPGRPLIAARIQNFAEITSTLPPDKEKALVEQIASRLMIGTPNPKLYQGDEGIFAWFADPDLAETIGDHLEALQSLFRSPVVVPDAQVDLTITFGVDAGSDRSLANRLGSALVAADEAAAGGLRWKVYDPAKLKNAAWKLSLLSQLDAAIDDGHLWVAYQPKLDLATRTITGAEALVRWTHPDKGAISPMEFIPAAEQSDRIEKLTAHVLKRAIAAAAAINARGISFDVAVNLSARLIDNAALVPTITDLLNHYGLPGSHLTLEVTETAALATGANLGTLQTLRDLGVQISIDDYGTGLSTLDYLKKMPATEIKIDRSFVQSMAKSHSDRLMVNSTIQLAHSLGQKVVAEGVEEPETLETLAGMGCDIAQGFLIARPMPFRDLMRYLLADRKRRAA